MTTVVVDASVALKWFVPEEHAAEALRFLDGTFHLLAPELLFPELGNILWKKMRRGELNAAEARAVLAALAHVPLEVVPASALVEAALEIAIAYDRTVYDALHLALAVARKCAFVTADARLAHAVASGPLARHVRALVSSN